MGSDGRLGKKRDADRRAEIIANASWGIEQALRANQQAEEFRHQQELENQAIEREQKKAERQFKLWWNTRTIQEKREYFDELEKKRLAEQEQFELENERRLAEEEKRDAKWRRDFNRELKQKAKRLAELGRQETEINGLERYTHISVRLKGNQLSKLRRNLKFWLLTSLFTISLAVLTSSIPLYFYLRDPGSNTTGLISIILMVISPLLCGWFYPEISNILADAITRRRVSKELKGQVESAKTVHQIIDEYKDRRGKNYVSRILGIFVLAFLAQMVFYPLYSYAVEQGKIIISARARAESAAEAETLNLSKAKAAARQIILDGEKFLSDSQSISDRTTQLDELKMHLANIEQLLTSTDSNALWATISYIQTDMVHIGTVEDFNLRKQYSASNLG